MRQRLVSLVMVAAALLAGCGAPASALAVGQVTPPSAQRQQAATVANPRIPDGMELSYGELLSALDDRQVAKVQIATAAPLAKITLRDHDERFTWLPDGDTQLPLLAHKAAADVSYVDAADEDDVFRATGGASIPDTGGPSVWAILLVIAGLTAIAAAFFAYQNRRQRAAAQPGPTAKKDKDQGAVTDTGVRFANVIGCDEAVEELGEILDFLGNPWRYRKVKAKLPSGALLCGPPGTGKTLLAKALAGEAGLPFFQASGSEFVEMYVGVGAKRVRDLFAKAKASPNGAIIFIDEIDAVGRKRSAGSQAGGNDEREQTLNQLLIELDGFSGRKNVFVLAATNRPDILDPALVRPGRFQNRIQVDPPGLQGRRALFALYTAGKPMADDVDLDFMAQGTAGCTGADIEDICNRAAIFCARHGRDAITMADLDEGHLWAIAGPEKKEQRLDVGEEHKIAAHEAGHVLTAEFCATHEKSTRVTIKARGSAGGLAKYSQRDRSLHDRQILHEKMVCLLGGRAAEKEVFGVVSSGAQNDLQRVGQIARSAVGELALVDGVGQVLTAGEELSQDLRRRVELEVEQLVAHAWADAQRIVAEHRVALDILTRALLEQKELFRVDIVAALNQAGVTPVGLATTFDEPRRPPVVAPPAAQPTVQPLAQPGRARVGLLGGRRRMRAAVAALSGRRQQRAVAAVRRVED